MVVGKPSSEPAGPDLRRINLFNYPFVDVAIAEGIAKSIYGSRWLRDYNDKLGYKTNDRGLYWQVHTTPILEDAGTFCVLIDKYDGRIIEVGLYFGPGGIPA